VDPLIAALKDSQLHPYVHREAAEALGEFGDARAVDPLLAALKDNKRNLGSYAKALGKIGDARAVEPLIAAFKDQDLEMYAMDRVDAVKALGMIGDARAVETLTTALKDKYREVGASAAFALGMLGDSRAVEPLIATLRIANSISMCTRVPPRHWRRSAGSQEMMRTEPGIGQRNTIGRSASKLELPQ
jgi:hypothetical protein